MREKVILFIVEGPSDQDALIPWIANELKKVKIKATVKVVYGDLLTEYIQNSKKIFNVTSSNVKGQLKNIIDNFIKNPIVKADQIKLKDIEKVYYITDTDNCFFNQSDSSINKKNCLYKMFNFNKIEMNSTKDIEFKVIFFAQNLEDVLCSKKDATDEEKEKISIEFGINCLKDRELFIKTFTEESLKIWNTYSESYEGIKSYTKRACNMNNFIDEIKADNI
ncbi:MAG: hypothetical protein ACRCZ0_01675 [Cetobacterium sp.]